MTILGSASPGLSRLLARIPMRIIGESDLVQQSHSLIRPEDKTVTTHIHKAGPRSRRTD